MDSAQEGVLRRMLGFRRTQEWQRPGWRNFYVVDVENHEKAALLAGLEDLGLVRLVWIRHARIYFYAATEDGARAVGVHPDSVRGM